MEIAIRLLGFVSQQEMRPGVCQVWLWLNQYLTKAPHALTAAERWIWQAIWARSSDCFDSDPFAQGCYVMAGPDRMAFRRLCEAMLVGDFIHNLISNAKNYHIV